MARPLDSGFPLASRACTATTAVPAGTGMVVSKPCLATGWPMSRNASWLWPPSSCHWATSVAPFQLTWTCDPSITASGGASG